MNRVLTAAAVPAALTGALLLAACGETETPPEAAQASIEPVVTQPVRQPELRRPKNTKRISARDLLDDLASAGLEARDLGEPHIFVDDSSRFPEEPRSTLFLRVSDGQGNSSPMIFLEFGSWKAAAELDTKPVNGFAVRNWFVLGTVNNHFVKLITEALG